MINNGSICGSISFMAYRMVKVYRCDTGRTLCVKIQKNYPKYDNCGWVLYSFIILFMHKLGQVLSYNYC